MNQQLAKIGRNDRMLTLDAYPKRFAYDPKKEVSLGLEYWPEYQRAALDLVAELTGWSRVRLVLGKENIKELERELCRDESLVVTSVEILIDNDKDTSSPMTMYGRKAKIWVLQDKTSMKLKQLVLPSCHLQYFFCGTDLAFAKVCDSTWNFCAAVAGLKDINSQYFEWRVQEFLKKSGPTSKMSSSLVGTKLG
jgi:hypothetical protein